MSDRNYAHSINAVILKHSSLRFPRGGYFDFRFANMELITGMGQIAQITFVGRQGDRACALFRSILIGLDLSIQFTISPRGNNADYAPDGIYCLRKKCSVCTFSHSDANTFARQPSHTRGYANLKWFLKMAAPLSCEDCTPVRLETSEF
jgi:hypothetical protein